ncbi:hypothetical protein GCM10009775_02850 [Microbacterium aoyamense]|uniref:Uncharacterized protein n=1 Tax=Microbacterium aoyamense TaxID=344166 RepID=A0ABN2P6R9_9MICO|nr:hypothetical protein [Microbacterium aoyamense]
MATREERRLQQRIDAIEDELASRRTPTEKQADALVTGDRRARVKDSGDDEADERETLSTSEIQARRLEGPPARSGRRVVRGATRGWQSEEATPSRTIADDGHRETVESYHARQRAAHDENERGAYERQREAWHATRYGGAS